MTNESDVPEVMDIHRASQYLGVSRETLYKYLNEERIPAFKLGNRWRLKKAVLDRWMESESSGVRVRNEVKAVRTQPRSK